MHCDPRIPAAASPDSDLGHTTLGQDLAVLRLRHGVADARRRRSLQRLAGLGLAGWLPSTLLAGCGGGGDAGSSGGASFGSGSTTGGSATTGTAASTSGTCATIPTETNGPYPADGTTAAVNALAMSGIVRSDITRSLTGTRAVAAGVPLTLTLTLVDAACTPLAGYAVYAWHCDAQGGYSLYSSAIILESYLRGVQTTDANGRLTFTTIVPGCYAGRWPHIHFEVYPSLTVATSKANAVKTSQLALPQDVCTTVYTNAASVYAGSLANLQGISLARDNVFADGYSLQMATLDGSITTGYAATLQVGVG